MSNDHVGRPGAQDERTRLRIPPWFRAEPVQHEGLYLIGERRETVFRGELGVALAPYLDGTRTVDEIVEALSDAFTPAEVYYAVGLAEREGILTSTEPHLGSAAEAFWGSLAHDPTVATARLAQSPVHVTGVGGADPEPMVAALRELGVNGLRVDDGDITNVAVQERPALRIVTVHDYLTPGLGAVNSAALRTATPWMPVKPTGTTIWFGPLFSPGTTACWECLAQRLSANREVPSYLARQRRSSGPVMPPVASLPFTVALATRLAAFHAARCLLGIPDRTDLLTTFDLLTMQSREHTVVRRPQCATCGSPQDLLAHVPPVLLPRKKTPAAEGSRSVTAEETVDRYSHHVSPLVGAVTELVRLTSSQEPAMHVYRAGHNFAVRSRSLHFLREGLRSKSAGKGPTDPQAKASALCEALERYSGIFQGEESRFCERYSRLGSEAIHPNSSMLFSARQYEHRKEWLARGSRFANVPLPFDEDAEVEWSRVWSLTDECWRLMPTGYLYYGYPHQEDQLYYWADSNGNAAGNTLEEAILQGFLEVVERDAVALWWYNRLSRPAVDLSSFDDPWISEVADRYRRLQRPLWVLDVTSDLGIPVFVAVSARTDKPVEDILVACGAHLDARTALRRTVAELNQFLPAVLPIGADGSGTYAFHDRDSQRWWRTATRANSSYLVPDRSRPARRAEDFREMATDNLRDDVGVCRSLVEKRGMEFLVLDQTRPDIGLPVAKVLVPGMRHFWARFGPGRLFDLPAQEKWLSEPLTEEQLNPVPLFL